MMVQLGSKRFSRASLVDLTCLLTQPIQVSLHVSSEGFRGLAILLGLTILMTDDAPDALGVFGVDLDVGGLTLMLEG
jgi:hypothetical protein